MGLVGEFEGRGVEELDALGELGHGFEPIVRILEADHGGLDAVAVEFLEELAGFPAAAAPGNVVALRGEFVEVVHLDGEDAVLQDADGLDGIDAEAQPVAEVGRGTDALAAAFAKGEHHFGTPGEMLGP